jgi:hypothetical protein
MIGMIWYGASLTPRQCILSLDSLRVVASYSVHPVTRVSEQHRQAMQIMHFALVRRWVRPCDLTLDYEWNGSCLYQTQ